MNVSYKATTKRQLVDSVVQAQKKMTSAEKVDVIGVIRLTKYALRLLDKMDDELIQFIPEGQQKRSSDPVEEESREEPECQLREFRKEIEESARRDDEWSARERKYRRTTIKITIATICFQLVTLICQIIYLVRKFT